MFTSLDYEFLQSLGYDVGETPKSDEIMSESTFLFTPGLEQNIIDACLDKAFPDLHITSGDLGTHNSFRYNPHLPWDMR